MTAFAADKAYASAIERERWRSDALAEAFWRDTATTVLALEGRSETSPTF